MNLDQRNYCESAFDLMDYFLFLKRYILDIAQMKINQGITKSHLKDIDSTPIGPLNPIRYTTFQKIPGSSYMEVLPVPV